MDIRQIVTLDSNERSELIRYARECSWQSTGSYFADCLEDNAFDSTEKVVAAYDDGKIIGFAALIKESCVEDTTLTPWLDFLFVDEKHRNKGTAKAMVDHLFRSAQADGIEKVYLCTVSHEKMYEKFDFVTLYKAKINGADECSVMEKQIESCK